VEGFVVKSGAMPDKPSLIHVEIFGQTYSVRAGTDPAYVERLARYVDGQMEEISRASGAVDSVRIAVLAALNIADECFRLRGQLEEAEKGTRGRAEKLARELGALLGE
jgi:cell division protein ZapA